jgi:hypothetical protein
MHYGTLQTVFKVQNRHFWLAAKNFSKNGTLRKIAAMRSVECLLNLQKRQKQRFLAMPNDKKPSKTHQKLIKK